MIKRIKWVLVLIFIMGTNQEITKMVNIRAESQEEEQVEEQVDISHLENTAEVSGEISVEERNEETIEEGVCSYNNFGEYNRLEEGNYSEEYNYLEESYNQEEIPEYESGLSETNHLWVRKFKIVSFVTDGIGGCISPLTVRRYWYGEKATYTFRPLEGYYVAEVQVDGVSVDIPENNVYIFESVSKDHVLEVTFSSKKHQITTITSEGGTVNYGDNDPLAVPHGSSIQAKIVANPGYKVSEIFKDGVKVENTNSVSFENVKEDHQLEVNFVKEVYKIETSVGEGGSVNFGSSDPTKVEYGETVSMTIVPQEGYDVSVLKVDGASVAIPGNNVYTFESVTKNHVLEVTFSSKKHQIITITSEGGTVNYGDNDPLAVPHGSSIQAKIVANPGYKVSEIFKDGVKVENTNSISFENVKEDHQLEVNFVKEVYKIETSVGEGGSVNFGSSDPMKVEYGETVSMTIVPQEGYDVSVLKVDGVSVAIPGNNVYTFESVTKNHVLEVTFSSKKHQIITITSEGGTVNYGDNDPLAVPHGSSIQAKIVANPGYKVSEIFKDGVKVENTNSISFENVKEDHQLEVNFVKEVYKIETSVGEGGSVNFGSSDPMKVEYGETVSMTIVPQEGYDVSVLKVDGVSVAIPGNNVHTFESVTKNHVLEVTFSSKKYQITTITSEGGTVNYGDNDPQSVPHGSSIQAKIVANPGYKVSEIFKDGVKVENTNSVSFENVKEDHQLEVNFVKEVYKIETSVGEGGSVNFGSSDPTKVEYGETVSMTIVPQEGYDVSVLKVDGASVAIPGNNVYTFESVIKNHVLEVTFSSKKYQITTITSEGGTVNYGDNDPQSVPHGSSIQAKIVANPGYKVSEIFKDGVKVENTNSVSFENVKENHQLEVNFVKEVYKIETSVGAGGNVNFGSSDPTKVEYGETVSMTIVPQEGYDVSVLKVDGASVAIPGNNVYTFESVTKNHVLEVTFSSKKYQITTITSEGGTVNYGDNDPQSVPHGSSIQAKIVANPGYKVSEIFKDGVKVENTNSISFENVKEDHQLEVNFIKEVYKIETSVGEGGSVNFGSSDPTKVEYGETVSMTIVPQEGYDVSVLKVDGASVAIPGNNVYTFESVTKNHVLEVHFVKEIYKIETSIGEGGSVDFGSSNPMKVEYGEDVKVKIVPTEGYKIKEVKVDGENLAVTEELVLNDVDENHNIQVSFELKTYSVILRSYGGGRINISSGTSSSNYKLISSQMNFDLDMKEEILIAPHQTELIMEIKPHQGKEIDRVHHNGENVEIKSKYSLSVKSNSVEEVYFKAKTGESNLHNQLYTINFYDCNNMLISQSWVDSSTTAESPKEYQYEESLLKKVTKNLDMYPLNCDAGFKIPNTGKN